MNSASVVEESPVYTNEMNRHWCFESCVYVVALPLVVLVNVRAIRIDYEVVRRW